MTAMDSFKSKNPEKKFLVKRSKRTTPETPDKKMIMSHWERRSICAWQVISVSLVSSVSWHFKQVCTCGIAFRRVAGIGFLQVAHKP